MGIIQIKPSDKKIKYTIKSIINRFVDHNIPEVAGQLSYFMLLSVFPFLIFLNALVASFDISPNWLTNTLEPIFPPQIVSLIRGYVENIAQGQNIEILSIGIIVVIFSASSSVRSLSFAINMAYGTTKTRKVVKEFFYSMLFVVAAGVTIVMLVLFVTLSRDVLTEIIKVNHLTEFSVMILDVFRWVMLILSLFLIFAIVYKITPNKKVSIKSIIPGTVFATLGLLLLTYGFSSYVDHFMPTTLFSGTIGVVLMLMLWIYFACVVVVLGAEINSALEERPRNHTIESNSEGDEIK